MPKVKAIMIMEIVGRPAEHVYESMENHVKRLGGVKKVEVLSENISNPKKLDIEQEMYSCFAEVEVEVENFYKLMDLIFDFMPSSVEVVEPGNLSFNSQEATVFLNDLSGRLHRYDEIAKIAQMKNAQLVEYIKKSQELAQEEKKKGKKKTKGKKKAPKKKS